LLNEYFGTFHSIVIPSSSGSTGPRRLESFPLEMKTLETFKMVENIPPMNTVLLPTSYEFSGTLLSEPQISHMQNTNTVELGLIYPLV
jgi:hypothetical protein